MSAWLRFDSIRRSLETAAPRRVLEVGAGEGALGAFLAQRFDYVGVEPDARSRAVAIERLRRAGRGQIREALPPAETARYDIVCAFEVLEHIDDDAVVVREWRQALGDRGYLLLSVPAHSSRFGASDRYVGHFRRYDRGALQRLLDAAGFDVVEWNSYGAGLGHMLDAIRNAVLIRRSTGHTAADGTALSGRLFQPRRKTRVLFNYLAALPFRLLQAPLSSTDIGIGYVVLARARAQI